MRVAYIAHPISGDTDGNLKKIVTISREINLNEPNVVPFAPYFLDCHALNDDIPYHRERGIKNDTYFLKSGIIDELRLYGDRISNGMKEEIKICMDMKIPVIATSIKLSEELNSILKTFS